MAEKQVRIQKKWIAASTKDLSVSLEGHRKTTKAPTINRSKQLTLLIMIETYCARSVPGTSKLTLLLIKVAVRRREREEHFSHAFLDNTTEHEVLKIQAVLEILLGVVQS